MKQLFGSKKGNNRINSINGKVDSEDMANDINDFFTDIGPRLVEGIPDSLLDTDLDSMVMGKCLNFMLSLMKRLLK